MHKEDWVLNNLQRLICHKSQTNKQTNKQTKIIHRLTMSQGQNRRAFMATENVPKKIIQSKCFNSNCI